MTRAKSELVSPLQFSAPTIEGLPSIHDVKFNLYHDPIHGEYQVESDFEYGTLMPQIPRNGGPGAELAFQRKTLRSDFIILLPGYHGSLREVKEGKSNGYRLITTLSVATDNTVGFFFLCC
ncbi:hypothetical protein AVEN_211866-1 [Araneus ventricosus]|uniref:Uncharacterized protein n=1 Tax=Araneus ventricosus TaxID=182803 RepID=A0A4Y2QMM1_ARAVE|nr:hypothetical protein AVEN_211866-1 [Araneus ventricosus]